MFLFSNQVQRSLGDALAQAHELGSKLEALREEHLRDVETNDGLEKELEEHAASNQAMQKELDARLVAAARFFCFLCALLACLPLLHYQTQSKETNSGFCSFTESVFE